MTRSASALTAASIARFCGSASRSHLASSVEVKPLTVVSGERISCATVETRSAWSRSARRRARVSRNATTSRLHRAARPVPHVPGGDQELPAGSSRAAPAAARGGRSGCRAPGTARRSSTSPRRPSRPAAAPRGSPARAASPVVPSIRRPARFSAVTRPSGPATSTPSGSSSYVVAAGLPPGPCAPGRGRAPQGIARRVSRHPSTAPRRATRPALRRAEANRQTAAAAARFRLSARGEIGIRTLASASAPVSAGRPQASFPNSHAVGSGELRQVGQLALAGAVGGQHGEAGGAGGGERVAAGRRRGRPAGGTASRRWPARSCRCTGRRCRRPARPRPRRPRRRCAARCRRCPGRGCRRGRRPAAGRRPARWPAARRAPGRPRRCPAGWRSRTARPRPGR